MDRVVFWNAGDLVVNSHDGRLTFEIISIEENLAGTWVIMKNLNTNEYINGFQIGLAKMGFVAYRKSKIPVLT